MKERNYFLFGTQIVLMLILLGIAVLFPLTTTRAVLTLFAALLIFQGMFTVIDSIIEPNKVLDVVWTIGYGLLSLLVGFALLIVPEVTLATLGYILAGWIFVSGVLDILRGIFIKKTFPREMLLLISGGLSIVLSVVIVAYPTETILAFLWFVGLYIAIWAIFSWAQAIRLETNNNPPEIKGVPRKKPRVNRESTILSPEERKGR